MYPKVIIITAWNLLTQKLKIKGAYYDFWPDQKQHESELARFLERAFNFLCIVLRMTKIAISLEPYAQFGWRFQQNIALKWESIYNLREMQTGLKLSLSSD